MTRAINLRDISAFLFLMLVAIVWQLRKIRICVVSSGSDQTRQTGNNAALLSNIIADKGLWILNNVDLSPIVTGMKRICHSLVACLVIGLGASAAEAACYADYKAKRDNPLKLHYGVMQLRGNCSKQAARSEVSQRLSANGWVLLNVLSVFDDGGLNQRKNSAGNFFLRY